MWTVKARDGIVRFSSLTLNGIFRYFHHSAETREGLNTAEYDMPLFSVDVVRNLEDAVVCQLYPELTEADVALIEFLQPIEPVRVYLAYTLPLRYAREVGKLVRGCDPHIDSPATHLYLDGYDEDYRRYIEYVGLKGLPAILPHPSDNIESTSKSSVQSTTHSLITLHNQLVVSLFGAKGGDDECREFLEGATLLGVWNSEPHPNASLVSYLKGYIADEVYRRILSPNTKSNDLYLYVSLLCPHLVYRRILKVELPWNVVLEESDPRCGVIITTCCRRIPLSTKVYTPPSDNTDYDDYYDGD